MDNPLALTILRPSGDVLTQRRVSLDYPVQALKADLAKSFGFPSDKVRLYDGARELSDYSALYTPSMEISLTCIFEVPTELSFNAFRDAVSRGQHGYVRAWLLKAGAQQRPKFLLGWDEDVGLDVLKHALLFGAGEEMIQALVDAAAESRLLEVCLTHPDKYRSNALHYAARSDPKTVPLLLAAARSYPWNQRLLLSSDKEGETVLHCAAASGRLEVVEAVAMAAKKEGVLGKLLTTRNKCGETPLHKAAAHGSATAILEKLLEAAQEEGLLEEVIEAKTSCGETLQQLAAEDEEAVVEFLSSMAPTPLSEKDGLRTRWQRWQQRRMSAQCSLKNQWNQFQENKGRHSRRQSH